MSDIIKDCQGTLGIASQITDCVSFGIKSIDAIIVSKRDAYPVCANGEYPTKAEVQTFLDSGQAYYMPITNGIKPTPTKNSQSGADTYWGIEKVISETGSFTCRYKNISNQLLTALGVNNLNNQSGQLWLVANSDNGYRIIGGAKGYDTNVYASDFAHDGFDTGDAYIDMAFNWRRNLNEVKLVSSVDDYKELTNMVNIGVYEYANTSGTAYQAISVDSFKDVTGWNKTTYPILYAKATATSVITFYGSDSDRTGGINALGIFDATVPGEGITGATLGGSLNLIADGLIVLNDLFDVVYNQII